LHIEEISPRPDLFSLLRTEDPLLETETPLALPTRLHQKQALTFMLRREQGWAFKDTGKDVWTKKEVNWGPPVYVNNIIGDS